MESEDNQGLLGITIASAFIIILTIYEKSQ